MWDDVELVTLQQAKDHAGITDNDRDGDLALKLEEAHAIVLRYVSSRSTTSTSSAAEWVAEMQTWDGDTAPKEVRAAVMRQFADLVRYRGDDDDDRMIDAGGGLCPRAKQLLAGRHDPALA